MTSLKPTRMNGMKLRAQRNEMTYETVMTDLYLMGVIPKDVCEAFTGRKVMEGLQLPAAAQELEKAQQQPMPQPEAKPAKPAKADKKE